MSAGELAAVLGMLDRIAEGRRAADQAVAAAGPEPILREYLVEARGCEGQRIDDIVDAYSADHARALFALANDEETHTIDAVVLLEDA